MHPRHHHRQRLAAKISGTPATGDTFTVQSTQRHGRQHQCAGIRQSAVAGLPVQRHRKRLGRGQRVDQRSRRAGSAGQHGADAQTAVNSQAQTNVQSVTGVNLDEEAAHLLQWQQSYQRRHRRSRSRTAVQQPAGRRQGRINSKIGDRSMRITQGMEQSQFLTALNQLESGISATQNGIRVGLRSLPRPRTRCGRLVNGYNQVLDRVSSTRRIGQSAQEA